MGWNGQSNSRVMWRDAVPDAKIDEYERQREIAENEFNQKFFEEFFKEEIESGDVEAYYV